MILGPTSPDLEVWHDAGTPWLPVRLLDGRWAWGERLERCAYSSDLIKSGAPCGRKGFCYRTPRVGSEPSVNVLPLRRSEK